MTTRTDFLNGAALEWATKEADKIGNVNREQIKVCRGNDLILTHANEKGDYSEPLWLASYGAGRNVHGQTPSEAIALCYVVSSLGERVNVP